MDPSSVASSSGTSGGKSAVPQHHHWHGVLDNALDAVGCTPLIRLQRIAREEGFKCNLCMSVANPSDIADIAQW